MAIGNYVIIPIKSCRLHPSSQYIRSGYETPIYIQLTKGIVNTPALLQYYFPTASCTSGSFTDLPRDLRAGHGKAHGIVIISIYGRI